LQAPGRVRAFFASIFGYFLSPLGLLILSALDTSMLFFLPFAVDAAVILLTARKPEWMLLYAALATAGSIVGAAGTFWIGRRAGEHGLERFVSRGRLARVKRQVGDRGAIALAVPSLVPPPFPFTPFILACGALDVSRTRFFATLAAMRMLRFTAEGWLASVYGRQILTWMKSTTFQAIVMALAVVAVAGTVAGVWMYFRHGGSRRTAAARPA
jgi:membrane protein YqaA with SNARE-associated domain